MNEQPATPLPAQPSLPRTDEPISICVAGPASKEVELQELAEQILATLDGPVNW